MLDFDEENFQNSDNDFDKEKNQNSDNSSEPFIEADSIDDGDYDYENKYRKTYGKYDFGTQRTNDKYGEYHTDKSYADSSHNIKEEWNGSRTGGWTSFFRSMPYPMICLVIYLIVGFVCNAWHPAWIIFLTIPAYYSMVEVFSTTGKVRFPLFTIVLIAYLLMGFLGNLWHPGWIVFFAWPLFFIFDNLMRIKQTRLIIYTFVCVAIYVIVGLVIGIWHPTWIIFLTIPIFESLYVSTSKLIKEKKGESKKRKIK